MGTLLIHITLGIIIQKRSDINALQGAKREGANSGKYINT